MEVRQLIYLLKNPSLVQASDVSELQSAIGNYPYFQCPRALQLKALKDGGSFVYNSRLKETAAYTTDREVLFDFISSKKTEAKEPAVTEVEVLEEKELEKVGVELDVEVVSEEVIHINEASLFESVIAQENKEEEEALEIIPQAPLDFSKEETHSFAEWLKLSALEPIVREEEKPKRKKLIESSLIENFLKNNPKIKPVKKSTQITNLAIHNQVPAEDLMTETLAKVYIAQGNYKKAIQAYKILSLKNPEKSGLFADQIRAIKKLQDNNK